MEGNSMLPSMGSSMLGLEMPLHPHPHQQQHQQHPNSNNTNPKPHHQHQYQHQQQQQQQQQHPQMIAFTSYDADSHSQSPQSLKQNAFPYPTTKPKPQQQQQQLQITLSDEEEPGFTGDDGGDGRKQASSWQRVKWTDNMIRLLIMVVFYVEDDGGHDVNDALGKKRSGGGLLQKKGKWKSVSRAMMEKGFLVSPQQCEDKFNDLNKRYKRVNDIIGKGTACRVVENQSLLDTLDHLSPKMKEEARKLLNSKHLFFREMCAYHNSGGIGGVGTGGVGGHHQPSQSAAESSHQHQQQQRNCFDSRNVVGKGVSHEEEDEDDDEEDDCEDEDGGDEEENHHAGGSGGYEDEDDDAKFSSKKRRRNSPLSPPIQELNGELLNLLQDGTKSPWEHRQWIRNRLMQLEEQQLACQYQAFELEKQRFKWVKFKEDKERKMEKMKLNNERTKLENERMVLLLRKKELELLELYQHQSSSNKRPNLSPIA